LAEELPLVWESVAHLFADIVAPAVAEQPAQQPMQDWKARLAEHEGAVNQFLISRNVLTSEQTWRDCEPDYLQRVAGRVDQFVNTALEWRATNA
jgi:hypothetical protein